MNDGGPAYPGTYRESRLGGVSFLVQREGMTLRDYFAGQALGFLDIVRSSNPRYWDNVAADAYAAADAMLRARAVQPEQSENR